MKSNRENDEIREHEEYNINDKSHQSVKVCFVKERRVYEFCEEKDCSMNDVVVVKVWELVEEYSIYEVEQVEQISMVEKNSLMDIDNPMKNLYEMMWRVFSKEVYEQLI